MYFDRFDVCEAYYALEYDWNAGGVLWERPTCRRRRQSVGVQLHRVRFRPRPSLGGYATLTENGQAIYRAFCERRGLVMAE
jgi:hypothetical protein